MNIDFNAALEAGMSEEDIINMMKTQLHKHVEEKRAKESQKINDKEALKAEGRAYLINALIAYSEAFDITDEPWDEEDIHEVEELLIKLEEMAPMYIKLAQMQGELDNRFWGNLGLGGLK
jgi:predicted unusual protein kinase regulating ubiquinone biosynthesis (AarF/ABC1/UbiB family)